MIAWNERPVNDNGSENGELMMKMTRIQLAVLVIACFVTVLLRVRDMPLRLDSMIALSLICGAVVRHPAAIILPLAIRLLTDVVLEYKTGYGFYPSMIMDYAAYLLIATLARHIPVPRYASVIAGGLLGPVLFFALSNFGVWYMWPETYAATWAGLMQCYAQGLPFLRDSIFSNFTFAMMFLGAWHVATVTSHSKSFTVASIDGGES